MYTRELVETLVPAVWDGEYAYGLPRPDTMPDPDMPKGWTNPKEGNKHYAYIADIKTAWAKADIPLDERRAMFLRFVLDSTVEVVAAYEGCAKSTAHERIYRGIGKLVAHLNGGEFVESYNEDDEDLAA